MYIRVLAIVIVGILATANAARHSSSGSTTTTSSSSSTTSGCTQNYTPDTKDLSGIIRDVWGCGLYQPNRDRTCGQGMTPNPCTTAGWNCGVDFERYMGDDVGLVKTTIDTTNRVPILDTSTSHPSVQNATQFAKWYLDDPFNIPYTLNITLSNDGTCNSLVYGYTNKEFYPIDGMGFGNYYNGHNYGFTFNFHGRFTYQGNEFFSFEGDDDVWVFINDKLAIDLGGVHGVESTTIDLTYPSGGCTSANTGTLPCSVSGGPRAEAKSCACSLGLSTTGGNTYTFDLFYNERHTVASDLAFTTSILIQCPWYDWCGVCTGNGQSCCHCTDNNPCTVDTCDINNGTCIFTPVPCDAPADKCTYAYCQTTGIFAGQCVTAPKNCNGTDVCMIYGCDSSSGCTTVAKTCNDNDPCTNDTCITNTGCKNTPRDCDDQKKCTIDSCSNGQCQHTDVLCDQSNQCTDNTCNPATGTCRYTNITQSKCITGSKCFIEGCNPSVGCTASPVDCNDHNACTRDTCNNATGCVHVNITSECDDHDACTIDSCDPVSGCVTVNVNCNDKDPCTADMCNSTSGCYHYNISCDRCHNVTCNQTNSWCEYYECDPSDGTCVFKSVDCDDGNPCTNDTCVSGLTSATCQNLGYNCPVTDACFPAVCNRTTAQCDSYPVVCDDGNKCTDDSCSGTGGNATCNFVPVVCHQTDACHPATCDPVTGTCQETVVICDDDNLCTNDSCSDVGGVAKCNFVPVVCPNPDACHTAFCNAQGQCDFVQNPPCNDGNNCTIEHCNATRGGCVFDYITCDDDNLCTQDSCDSVLGCVFTPIVCNDKNACTQDACYPDQGCNFTVIAVPAGDLCTGIFCDPVKGLINTTVECPRACSHCDPAVGCQGCPSGSKINVIQAVGIGAGAIAGIVIAGIIGAALLAWSGRKGYQMLMRKKDDMATVQDNPMYEKSKTDHENPFYKGKDV